MSLRKNATSTLRLVTTGRTVQVAQAVVVLAVNALWVASPDGVALLPVPVLVHVICKDAIGIVLPALPVMGPAGDETVSVAGPVELLRSEPETVVVEHGKCRFVASVGAHVIAALLIVIAARAAAVTPTEKGALEVAAAAGSTDAPKASANETATAIRLFKRKSF